MIVKNNKGFTLIELLVVISIIGILATVIGVNYNTTKKTARDAKRKADMENVAAAIELFYSQNKYYPCSSGINTDSWDSMISKLKSSGYLTSNIQDPQNNSTNYYSYDTDPRNTDLDAKNCTKFRVIARLENTNEPETISTSVSDRYETSGVYKNSSNNIIYQVVGK